MRATAWAIGGVGTVVGAVIIASALLAGATPPGLGDGGGLGQELRAMLVGVVIIAVSVTVAATVRRRDLWAERVFVLLGILAAAAALWWAVAELLG